jgi:hypothetical protein
MKKFLEDLNDNFPVATVSYVAGVALVCIGYFNGELAIEGALAYLGGGGAAVGWVRNKAGKGLHRHKNPNS